MGFQDCPALLFGLSSFYSLCDFCHSDYSSAFTPPVPVGHDQVTLSCKRLGGTEIRSPGFVTFGLRLSKPQLSYLENEFNRSLSLTGLLTDDHTVSVQRM